MLNNSTVYRRFSKLISVLLLSVLACSSQKEAGSNKTAERIQVASPVLELKKETSPTGVPPQEKLTPQDVQIQTLPKETLQEGAKEGAEPLPFQPTIVTTGLAAMILLDGSGSMNGPLGTETKFGLALSLIEDLSHQWRAIEQPSISLGVRTFGSQSPLEDNHCEDSKLLQAVGPIDPQSLKKSLSLVTAKGKSNIAFALRKGGEDLSPINEDRVMVLLADGKENCGQDPCAVAKELHDGPAKIITHVIGFDVTQEDEEALRCIAKVSNGVFLLARTKEELASSLDEALRSTIPYNLRIKSLVGGTPIPTTITVYKAGTQEVLKKEESFGIELFRLPPGGYDILVEYAQSIETKRPSKILKGVELTEKGKVEQEVRFDLASVTLSARDSKGEPTATHYLFLKAGSESRMAALESNGEETTFFIAPGNYDIAAQATALGTRQMTLNEPNIQVGMEEGFVKHFSFQTGTLILKGVSSNKEPVGLIYKITRSENAEAVITDGQVDASGGKIELPPGIYDIHVEGQDPLIQIQPRGFLKELAIEGGSILEKEVILVVGTFNLSAKKADGKLTAANFKILDAEDKKEVATIKAPEGQTQIALSPGKYDIQAFLTAPIYTTPPSTQAEGVELQEGKTIDQALTFQLGTLKLLGRNAKEQRLHTGFTIYNGGTEEVIAQAGPNNNWFEFDLGAGNYDVKGIQEDAAEPKPTVWLRDVTIEAGSLYVREAVFTNAKIKLIGRGTNNEIVPVEFKIYEYGHDRPLVGGVTGQDWQTFDLIPGQYYIEASYLDQDTDQTLKKWITLKVGENEFVERELRF